MFYGTMPFGTRIEDVSVVASAAGLTVVCADFRGDVWSWDPVRGTWHEHSLEYAYAPDPAAAAYPDADNRIDRLATCDHDGRTLLVGGGAEQAPARWELDSGQLLRGTRYTEPYLHLWEPSTRDVIRPLCQDGYLEAATVATGWIGGRSLSAGTRTSREERRRSGVAAYSGD